MTLSEVPDGVLERLAGARTVLVSRACPPDIASWLAAEVQLAEAPVASGVTVWEAGERADVALVVDPNWYGCREPAALVDRARVPTAHWRRETRRPTGARRLAKRLAVLPKTTLPHGEPSTAAFVAMLPCDPERLPLASSADVAATPVGRPELPGGVRFDVAPEIPAAEVTRYAAALEDAIRTRLGRHG